MIIPWSKKTQTERLQRIIEVWTNKIEKYKSKMTLREARNIKMVGMRDLDVSPYYQCGYYEGISVALESLLSISQE